MAPDDENNQRLPRDDTAGADLPIEGLAPGIADEENQLPSATIPIAGDPFPVAAHTGISTSQFAGTHFTQSTDALQAVLNDQMGRMSLYPPLSSESQAYNTHEAALTSATTSENMSTSQASYPQSLEFGPVSESLPAQHPYWNPRAYPPGPYQPYGTGLHTQTGNANLAASPSSSQFPHSGGELAEATPSSPGASEPDSPFYRRSQTPPPKAIPRQQDPTPCFIRLTRKNGPTVKISGFKYRSQSERLIDQEVIKTLGCEKEVSKSKKQVGTPWEPCESYGTISLTFDEVDAEGKLLERHDKKRKFFVCKNLPDARIYIK